jgi:copper(I)-binding protein
MIMSDAIRRSSAAAVVKRRVRGVVSAAAVTLLGAPVFAQTTVGIVVRDAWIREAAVTHSSTAAYCTIENRSALPVLLVAAEVEGAGVVELHEMTMTGDVMGMVRRTAIEIPPRGTVELKPGGFHVMVLQLKRTFELGGSAALTLRFSGGVTRTVRAAVRPRAAVRK